MAIVTLGKDTYAGTPVAVDLQGLSSDAPPTTLASGALLPDGSTLHLVDTGERFVFHAGDWLPDLRAARALKDSLALP